MKKILIIGAGIGQVNLVKLAQSRGCHVTVVSIKGDYPCISLADDFFECDIYDKNNIVEFAKRNHIDAVLSDQNDLMMPTVAYVAEKLSLPGNSLKQQLSYTDKNIFKGICNRINVPVPNHVAVTTDIFPIDFHVPFPWIIKPADSQSSIGISIISSVDAYADSVNFALSKSKKREAIVEEFFIGQEFVCEGFIYKGKYYHLMFGDRRYFENSLLPCQTLFPSNILPVSIQKQIIDCETKIAAEVNPLFGIVHSEYLVNLNTGEFRVIDSALRGGGVYISSHLVPLTTNIDINSILLDCALGINISIPDKLKNIRKKSSAYVCFNLPQGVVKSIIGIDEITQLSYVHKCDVNLQIGQKIGSFRCKGDRLGPIIVSGDNREELERNIDNIKSLLKIKINDNTKTDNDIIWS